MFSGRPEPWARRAVAAHPRAITVGSFDFAESRLLAEIYGQALEDGGSRPSGLRVRAAGAGGSGDARGLVDLVPEYAGTALQFLSLGGAQPEPDVAATHERSSRLQGSVAQALAPASAQDTNAFVVSRAMADAGARRG